MTSLKKPAPLALRTQYSLNLGNIGESFRSAEYI